MELGIEDYKGLIADTEAAIKKSKSTIDNYKSDYDNYKDEYNRAKRNDDESMMSHWKSQMNWAQRQIDSLQGILDGEQADLKKYQAALAEFEKQSTSTVGSGSSSTTKSGSSTSTVDSGSSSTTSSTVPRFVGLGSSSTSGGSSTSTTSSGSSSTRGIISSSTTSGGSTTTTSENTSLTPQVRIYAGGDKIISDYQSGEQIFLGTMPTGYIFGGGNFAMTSATGTLFIANANDKIINFVDGAGNDFAKAYAATYPGVIDLRGLAGYEVINGSDYGADAIFAGDGGSQLWGGNGVDSDTLVGGAGADVFIGGKMQGSDVMMNAASTDVVFLNDALLGDIVAAAGDGGAVAIAFNTGNVVMIGSSEPLSAAFMLADGSAYRYNHVAQAWQTA